MKIRAAVLRKIKSRFSIETVDLASPRAGEVRVRMAAAGVCHSDWHLVSGDTRHPLPVVAGHEGAGIVEKIGKGVSGFKPGDHVILNWAPNCGGCFYCRHHRPNLCSTYLEPIWAGTLLDGTPRLSKKGRPIFHYCGLACFAEHAVVPQECCVKIKKKIPLTVAALIGCAVTTGVGAVLNTAKVPPGSSVMIFGAGGVGLSMVMGAKLAGATRIVVVDRARAKMELSKTFGATHALPAGKEIIERVRALTGGRGADYVFDATGIPAVQEQCLDAARPGGTVVLAGLAPMGSATNFPGAILTRQEKTVKGTYYGSADPARDFPIYADLYLRGKLPLDKLISRTWPLKKINEAFAEMLTGNVARGVIVF